MTQNTNYIGNGTTIGKFILIAFAGWIIGLAASKGLDLGVDATTLAQIIGVIIGLIYSYIDAKHPNTFKWLNNNPINAPLETEETVLNDEYECDEDEC